MCIAYMDCIYAVSFGRRFLLMFQFLTNKMWLWLQREKWCVAFGCFLSNTYFVLQSAHIKINIFFSITDQQWAGVYISRARLIRILIWMKRVTLTRLKWRKSLPAAVPFVLWFSFFCKQERLLESIPPHLHVWTCIFIWNFVSLDAHLNIFDFGRVVTAVRRASIHH